MTQTKHPLETLITKFLRLETIAHALYIQHLTVIDPKLRPIFERFAMVEERHREHFRRLYRELLKREPPRFTFSIWCMTTMARLCNVFGLRSVLHFECWIEEQAVRDYTDTLMWIKEPKIKDLIERTLADEQIHAPLMQCLRAFRKDEEHHIEKMMTILNK